MNEFVQTKCRLDALTPGATRTSINTPALTITATSSGTDSASCEHVLPGRAPFSAVISTDSSSADCDLCANRIAFPYQTNQPTTVLWHISTSRTSALHKAVLALDFIVTPRARYIAVQWSVGAAEAEGKIANSRRRRTSVHLL